MVIVRNLNPASLASLIVQTLEEQSSPIKKTATGINTGNIVPIENKTPQGTSRHNIPHKF